MGHSRRPFGRGWIGVVTGTSVLAGKNKYQSSDSQLMGCDPIGGGVPNSPFTGVT